MSLIILQPPWYEMNKSLCRSLSLAGLAVWGVQSQPDGASTFPQTSYITRPPRNLNRAWTVCRYRLHLSMAHTRTVSIHPWLHILRTDQLRTAATGCMPFTLLQKGIGQWHIPIAWRKSTWETQFGWLLLNTRSLLSRYTIITADSQRSVMGFHEPPAVSAQHCPPSPWILPSADLFRRLLSQATWDEMFNRRHFRLNHPSVQ